MSNGIVVQHKDSNVRYAVSRENHDEATEVFVRDLKPGETTLSYAPKLAPAKGEADPERDEAEKAQEELQAPAITEPATSAKHGTPTTTKTEATPTGDAKATN